MTTRQVTGTVLRTDGTPWAGATVTVRRKRGSYTAGAQYPPSEVTTQCNNSGVFLVELWVNEEGAAYSEYEAVLPGGDRPTFTLPAGDTVIDLSVLRSANDAPAAWQSTVQSLIDTAISAAYSDDKHYRHVQSVASAEWTVSHNLGKYPAITVVDSARRFVLGEIQHVSVNQAILSFSAAFAGEAYCN